MNNSGKHLVSSRIVEDLHSRFAAWGRRKRALAVLRRIDLDRTRASVLLVTLTRVVTLSTVLGWLSCAPASADENFYKDKTLRVVAGYGSGGGYDLYGCVYAEFIGRFIPGEPQRAVSNSPPRQQSANHRLANLNLRSPRHRMSHFVRCWRWTNRSRCTTLATGHDPLRNPQLLAIHHVLSPSAPAHELRLPGNIALDPDHRRSPRDRAAARTACP